MTVNEIRASGILEQYAMGVLSEQEVQMVEGYLLQFPVLQQDYIEIQNSLQALATEKSRKPRATLENEIVHSILSDSNNNETNESKEAPKETNKEKPKEVEDHSRIWKFITGLLAVSALAAVYFFWNMNAQYNQQSKDFTKYKLECDSIANTQQETIDLFNQLNQKENNILNMTPTDGYPETQLLFHFNPVQKTNFIQIQNLPTIASNQAFQLWSLKPGADPIPLTVFKNENDIIVPVSFEEGTGTYAITIENEGGALVPSLDRLIGTVGV